MEKVIVCSPLDVIEKVAEGFMNGAKKVIVYVEGLNLTYVPDVVRWWETDICISLVEQGRYKYNVLRAFIRGGNCVHFVMF